MVRRVELGRLVLVLLVLVLLVLALLLRWLPLSLRHQAWPLPTGGCRPGLRVLPAVAWACLPQREPVGVWGLR
jgi:hypothetical protein